MLNHGLPGWRSLLTSAERQNSSLLSFSVHKCNNVWDLYVGIVDIMVKPVLSLLTYDVQLYMYLICSCTHDRTP